MIPEKRDKILEGLMKKWEIAHTRYYVVAYGKFYDIHFSAFCECLFSAKLKRAYFKKRLKLVDPEGSVKIIQILGKEIE